MQGHLFVSMWLSMMRLTSSAMEIPRRLASRLRNARCGSVNEIICLVMRGSHQNITQACVDFFQRLVYICLSQQQMSALATKTIGDELQIDRLLNPNCLRQFSAAVEGTEILTWRDPQAALTIFVAATIADRPVAAMVSVQILQMLIYKSWRGHSETLKQVIAVNAISGWNITPECGFHFASIPQGIQP